MQLIKALVIGMSVVIAVGFAVLVYGWLHHWGKTMSSSEVAAAQTARAPLTEAETRANAAPFDITVPAPEGMHFEQMVASGGRTLLRFSGPQGERIVVVDPQSGRVAGTIGVPAAGK